MAVSDIWSDQVLSSPDGGPLRGVAGVTADASAGLDLLGHPGELAHERRVLEARIGGVGAPVGLHRVVGAVGEHDVTGGVVLEAAALFGATADEVPGADLAVRPVAGLLALDGLVAGLVGPDEDGVVVLVAALPADAGRREGALREGGAGQLGATAAVGAVAPELEGVAEPLVRLDHAGAEARVDVAGDALGEGTGATNDPGLAVLGGGLDGPGLTIVLLALGLAAEGVAVVAAREGWGLLLDGGLRAGRVVYGARRVPVAAAGREEEEAASEGQPGEDGPGGTDAERGGGLHVWSLCSPGGVPERRRP